jgi:hypothetical protein
LLRLGCNGISQPQKCAPCSFSGSRGIDVGEE